MATINVSLSGLQPSLAAVNPAIAAIQASFSQFGVNLNFIPGLNLTADPEQSGQWPNLVNSLIQHSQQNKPPGPAHLVVTYLPPHNDLTINGMLMDQMRGVSAVYMGAGIYPGHNPMQFPNLVAQVCVHELGHMLDLTHTDGANSAGGPVYPNAMNQATQRASAPPQSCWTAAVHDAQARGEPPLAVIAPGYVYPFNAACRAYLRAAATNWQWLPFATAFRGNYQGSADDQLRQLTLTVGFEQPPVCQINGVLFASLVIENRGTQPIDLPLHLGLDDGTVRLVMHDPDGDILIHRPTKHRCSSARRVLLPGQAITVPIAAASTQKVPLFEKVGPHECEFSIIDHLDPLASVLGRVQVVVEVVDTLVGRDAADRLIRASGQRSPKVVQDDLNAGDPIVAHLNSRRFLAGAKARSGAKARFERLAALFGPEHPLAVRHSAATRFAVDKIRKGHVWAIVADELYPAFNSKEHDLLFEQIQRSGQGWIVLADAAPEGVL